MASSSRSKRSSSDSSISSNSSSSSGSSSGSSSSSGGSSGVKREYSLVEIKHFSIVALLIMIISIIITIIVPFVIHYFCFDTMSIIIINSCIIYNSSFWNHLYSFTY